VTETSGQQIATIMKMSPEQVISGLDLLGADYNPDAPIEELRALLITEAIASNTDLNPVMEQPEVKVDADGNETEPTDSAQDNAEEVGVSEELDDFPTVMETEPEEQEADPEEQEEAEQIPSSDNQPNDVPKPNPSNRTTMSREENIALIRNSNRKVIIDSLEFWNVNFDPEASTDELKELLINEVVDKNVATNNQTSFTDQILQDLASGANILGEYIDKGIVLIVGMIKAQQATRAAETQEISQAVTNRRRGGSKPVPNQVTFHIRESGLYLDGWADVVENRGEVVTKVIDLLFDVLSNRQMPDVRITRSSYTHSEMGGPSQTRFYTLTGTYPKGTTYIYVGDHGQDLLVSWRTFVKPVANIENFLAIGLISFFIAFFVGWGVNSMSRYSILGTPLYDGFGLQLTCFTFTFGFFALLFASLFALAGRVLHGDISYYFQRQPTLFDIDDITAMSITVHKSLLSALETVGIEKDLLRLKQDFTAGQQGQKL